MSLMIYGAGQIGDVVASILRGCGHSIAGFIDNRLEAGKFKKSGLPILGNRRWIAKNNAGVAACNGVGNIAA